MKFKSLNGFNLPRFGNWGLDVMPHNKGFNTFALTPRFIANAFSDFKHGKFNYELPLEYAAQKTDTWIKHTWAQPPR